MRLDGMGPDVSSDVDGLIRADFDEHAAVLARCKQVVPHALQNAVNLSIKCLDAGNRVFAMGNGGSAAQVHHFVSELVGRFERDRPPLAAVSLVSDAATITSLANDDGFTEVFSRQVRALAVPGDVVVAFSTSGTSPNVVAAMNTAAELGCATIALTGESGGDLADIVDVLVPIPSTSVARIQEMHLVAVHSWCARLDEWAEQAIDG